jgi:tRNA pseudouridine38-40 synthase
MRWKCICSYDGTDFNGWQSQPNGNTIQDVLEKRLGFIFGRAVRIHGSGRTDAGVHARWQVFHFDADWPHGADKLVRAFGCGIPKTVRVFSAENVDESFHARFSAVRKRYKYYLSNAMPSPFDYRYVWNIGHRDPDIGAMNSVAEKFLGEHDFSQFGATSDCDGPENTRKTMYSMGFVRADDPCGKNGKSNKISENKLIKNSECEFIKKSKLIKNFENKLIFTVEGSGFLYKMVRILVGSFIQVGIGSVYESALLAALNDPFHVFYNFRKECAPACGLFLDNIDY